MPLAFLERAGHQPIAQDLAIEPLDEELIRTAEFVGISVPMHTALRLGVRVATRVRELNPRVHLCFFGLYAPLNEAYLRACGADSILGGEHEAELVELVSRLSSGVHGVGVVPPVTLAKLAFPQPQRIHLPALRRYATLIRDGRQHVAGYTETSRGCLHMCRHCPIPPVYGGRFFVVPVATVLADVARPDRARRRAHHVRRSRFLQRTGARHGDRARAASALAGGHVRRDDQGRVILIAHAALLGELASLGCAFVVSAVESLDDGVLARLDKGHTRADFERALALTRRAGLVLRPTFVPFTPWTTLDHIADLVDVLAAEDLIECVDPVQLSVRLLVPPGSLLLGPETPRRLRRARPRGAVLSVDASRSTGRSAPAGDRRDRRRRCRDQARSCPRVRADPRGRARRHGPSCRADDREHATAGPAAAAAERVVVLLK